MKGDGILSVYPSIVTCNSCIASRSALCTLGGARLISSASSMFVKTGPLLNSNSRFFMLKMKPPTMSSGSISGVNCTLLNARPRHFEKAFASIVLETPGTPSMRVCPLASSETSRSSVSSSLPTTTLPTSFSTLVLTSVDFTSREDGREPEHLILDLLRKGRPAVPERLIPLQGELNPTPVDLKAKAFGEGECLPESETRRQVGERLLKRLLEQREGEHWVFDPRRRRSSPRLEDA